VGHKIFCVPRHSTPASYQKKKKKNFFFFFFIYPTKTRKMGERSRERPERGTGKESDVNQLIQNTGMNRLTVSSEQGTPKKHSETVFFLTKFNITYIP